ncbi:MAG TPA: pyruvate, phosphate dikinase [Spirochaeta sp.]|nr:pyruvate, phosphate dikinase [Spirochaeta sp.]
MKSEAFENNSLLQRLNERAKELDCLYRVKEIITKEQLSVDDVFSKLVSIIPSGWQFPDLCSARIVYENKTFESDNFVTSKWFQNVKLNLRGKTVGAVELHYNNKNILITNPFLPEEQQLLNSIAERIENFLYQGDLQATIAQWEIAKKDLDSNKKPDWMIILELVEKMDSNLFNKLSRLMLNRLCLLGVEDAKNVLGCLGINKSCENIPAIQDLNIPSLKIKFELYNKFNQNIFKIASDNLSSDDITDYLNKWIREDKTGFLVSVLENTNSPISEIAAAISRFHHLDLTDVEISTYSSSNINTLFIQRIFTEQIELVRPAREYIDINDFYPILQHSIYPNNSHGKLGGKSAGLFIAWQFLKKSGIEVSIPHTWCVSSDYMLKFVYYNNLEEVLEQKYKNIEEIRADYTNLIQVFKNSNFPIDLVNSLSMAIEDFGQKPIIIRSSSLLEDRFGSAFSGKYKSLFLANQGTKEERLTAVLDAIAEIYASIFGPDPIEYRKEHNLLEFHEEMAILIQEVVGEQVGDYFFPSFAGVGFGYNEYRWSPKIRKEDGLLRIVPGLGTRAVDRLSNDYPVLICPSNPGLKVNPMPTEAFKYSPRMMDVINLRENIFETIEINELIKKNPDLFPDIEKLFSVFEDDIFKTKNRYQLDFEKDELVFTLEPLIATKDIIRRFKHILDTLKERLDTVVDIEFAYSKDKLYLLQCRPQAGSLDSIPAPIPMETDQSTILFTAKKFITNGIVDNINYVVYVDPDQYNALSSLQDLERVGKAVGKLNSALPKRRFILMGPGRWGSRGDIKMGVKVNYSDINNTAMLLEIARKKGDYVPEVSFGTHFFQDLVEASIKYLPLYPDDADVVFNDAEITRSKNMLSEILPEFSDLSDVVFVTDIKKENDGKILKVFMNEDINQAIAIFDEASAAESTLDIYSHTDVKQLDYWSWRYSMAETIAASLEPARFGVKAMYLIGSTKNANAGPMSDIDLLIHIEEGSNKKGMLSVWLDGWSRCLGRMNFLRTGYKTDQLLDVHYITDLDIAQKTSMAIKINAITDAARKLNIGPVDA